MDFYGIIHGLKGLDFVMSAKCEKWIKKFQFKFIRMAPVGEIPDLEVGEFCYVTMVSKKRFQEANDIQLIIAWS